MQITVNGKPVQVGDNFRSLSPEQQNKTVDEIAAAMGGQQAGPVALKGQVQPQEEPTTQPSPNVEMAPNQKSSAQFGYDQSLEQIHRKYYPQMSDEQFARAAQEIYHPQNALDIIGDAGMLGLKDEVTGLTAALPHMFDGRFQEVRDDFTRLGQRQRDLGLEQMGGAALPLELTGAVLSGGASLANTATKAIPLGARALEGGAQAATQAGLYGFGSADGDFGDRAKAALTNAAVAAPLGIAAPFVGNAVSKAITRGAQRSATNAAIKGAPDAATLKAEAGPMFNEMRKSGVAIEQAKFAKFADQTLDDIRLAGFDPATTPQAVGIVNKLTELKGKSPTLADLHILRQISRNAAKESAIGSDTIHAVDEFVAGLKPSDIAIDPMKPVTSALERTTEQANKFLKAISTWGRAKRIELVEEAIYKAQNAGSGFENGLRNAFRSILNDAGTRRMFSKPEIQAMEDVVRGTTRSNVVKLLGKFGFGSGQAANMMGGSIGLGLGATLGAPLGPWGSMAGSAIVGGLSAGARKLSENMTSKAAQRAMRVVATPREMIPEIAPRLPGPRTNLVPGGLGTLLQYQRNN